MCPISELPPELIETISEFSLRRHSIEGYVTDPSSLAAFSSTSRYLRTVSMPILFGEIAVTSEEEIFALSRVDAKLLARTRELNVFLDVPLFESLKFWGFVRRGTGPPRCESPFDGLAQILSRTPSLSAFRILIANLTGTRSAWSPLFAKSPFAIPISDALCRSKTHISLPNLAILELDGFSDIDRLLQAAPNLQRLRLRLSGGFPQYVNVELVRGLKYVPRLRELVYTPSTLRVRGETTLNAIDGLEGAGDTLWNFPGEAEDEISIADESRMRVELMHDIGSRVPLLQNLVLETRWYGRETKFCAPNEILSPIALIQALSNFERLEYLALPTTVFELSLDDDEGNVLRNLYANIPDALLLIDAREHADLSAARLETLNRTTDAEQDVASALFTGRERPSSLQKISFVRPLQTNNGGPHAVQYTTRAASHQRTRRAEIGESFPLQASAVITTCRCAAEDQSEPLPSSHTRPPFILKLSSLRELLCSRGRSSIKSGTALFKRDSQKYYSLDTALMTSSVALATLGGYLMGDAVARDAVVHRWLGSAILSGVGTPIAGGVLSGSVVALTGCW